MKSPHEARGPGQIVGYLRVSSQDQNPARQLEDVTTHRRFIDTQSGRNTQRPALEEMLAYVRRGDRVIVHSMDRLARNVDDLRHLVAGLTTRGVEVQFLRENLTFTGEDSPLANLLLSVLGAVAQFERDLIRERQREGVDAAKRRGVYKGRPPKFRQEQAAEIAGRVSAGESVSKIAREVGVNRQTIYRYAAAAGVAL